MRHLSDGMHFLGARQQTFAGYYTPHFVLQFPSVQLNSLLSSSLHQLFHDNVMLLFGCAAMIMSSAMKWTLGMSANVSSFLSCKISLAEQIPNSMCQNLFLPQGELNVRRKDGSSVSCTCQELSFMSTTENTSARYSLVCTPHVLEFESPHI